MTGSWPDATDEHWRLAAAQSPIGIVVGWVAVGAIVAAGMVAPAVILAKRAPVQVARVGE